ncbi:nicotinate-nucleotide adenylyltransferase [Marinobacter sp. 1_MG-2023]|uniref:nicotinate-nucleotide adenylyltransferase n=1 Tax=Marinobacter sp. 1_MG-2023 TaxID=3062627 RepID=UPI0026E45FC6|nr:nicotinate-nucleotide adenylyltransferase [Marinobacter sp. 1_MG-2023]MDO6825361.1 nicotinate-nucleotide adenylyltransferase [Marinobacter sp. 1_MG-2023]
MHVIYGGTFDPVHHGHLRLALEVSERLGNVPVSLVPCHIPPHRGQTGATAAQRLRLLELAIEGEPRLSIDDRELRREGASYTADTLRQLRGELGADIPLVMVVGTDAFAGFDKWKEWQKISGLAHIIVVRRPGAELDPVGEPARLLAERGVGNDTGSEAGNIEALSREVSGRILELDPPWLDISATGIRERIGSGRSPRYLMPDRVWVEIQRMGLYGACPVKNF